MKSNELKDAFTSVFKEAGFKKKGNSWFYHNDETILIANLQKSNFGSQYYVNLAVWLKSLGDITFPKENQCHIRMRADSLAPEQRTFLNETVFNLENVAISADERLKAAYKFLKSTALPFLLACGSRSELQRFCKDGGLRGAAIMKDAQELLKF